MGEGDLRGKVSGATLNRRKNIIGSVGAMIRGVSTVGRFSNREASRVSDRFQDAAAITQQDRYLSIKLKRVKETCVDIVKASILKKSSRSLSGCGLFLFRPRWLLCRGQIFCARP